MKLPIKKIHQRQSVSVVPLTVTAITQSDLVKVVLAYQNYQSKLC
jgi:hypothetical protein